MVQVKIDVCRHGINKNAKVRCLPEVCSFDDYRIALLIKNDNAVVLYYNVINVFRNFIITVASGI